MATPQSPFVWASLVPDSFFAQNLPHFHPSFFREQQTNEEKTFIENGRKNVVPKTERKRKREVEKSDRTFNSADSIPSSVKKMNIKRENENENKKEKEREEEKEKEEKEKENCDGQQKERPTCRRWVQGFCPHGDTCTFPHPSELLASLPLVNIHSSLTPVSGNSEDAFCKYFLNGSCMRGATCLYSHDFKTLPCRFFWGKGYCQFGSACKFSHNPISDELKQRLLNDWNCYNKKPLTPNLSPKDYGDFKPTFETVI